METQILGCDDSEWQVFLQTLEEYSFFSSPTWARILADGNLGYRAQAILCRTDHLQVLLPHTIVKNVLGMSLIESMPYGTYGGARLQGRGTADELEQLRRAIRRYLGRQLHFLHLVASPGPFEHLDLEGIQIHNETHRIDLRKGRETIWKEFDPDARNQIRQAERGNVEIEYDNSLAAFQDYYRMLTASAMRWGKHAVGKPAGLFEAIARHADSTSLRLWFARAGGQRVAGALCFYGKGEVFYWSGAMYKEYARARGNNLLQWTILQDAITRGYHWYNMGASDGLPGVRRFKEGFGARGQAYVTSLVTGAGLQYPYQFGLRWRRLRQK